MAVAVAIAILLLWVGWFGFNPGSVLAFNNGRSLWSRQPSWPVNGILMGLIIITPLAGFVSPGSALILGLLGGPLIIAGERLFARFTWLSDPVGLLPGHLVGGLFGVVMIAFFTQMPFASGSGFPALPNGLLFGGGGSAIKQLGLEVLGIVAVMAVVFAISYVTIAALSAAFGGILTPLG